MADWDADDFEAEAPGKTVTTVVDKWEGEDDDSDCKVTAREILELFCLQSLFILDMNTSIMMELKLT